jgi:hypothetical protein
MPTLSKNQFVEHHNLHNHKLQASRMDFKAIPEVRDNKTLHHSLRQHIHFPSSSRSRNNLSNKLCHLNRHSIQWQTSTRLLVELRPKHPNCLLSLRTISILLSTEVSKMEKAIRYRMLDYKSLAKAASSRTTLSNLKGLALLIESLVGQCSLVTIKKRHRKKITRASKSEVVLDRHHNTWKKTRLALCLLTFRSVIRNKEGGSLMLTITAYRKQMPGLMTLRSK